MGTLFSRSESARHTPSYVPSAEKFPRQSGDKADWSNTARPGESDADFAFRLAMDSGYTSPVREQPSPLAFAQDVGESDADFAARVELHHVLLLTIETNVAERSSTFSAISGTTLEQSRSQSLPHAQEGSRDERQEGKCVVCLDADAVMGIVHGDTVHRCVCDGCSKRLGSSANCPLCKLKIERYLRVY